MNALVTGGSKGIGKAIALKLAALNYNLVICSRGMEDVKMVQAEIQQKYPQVQVHPAVYDLSNQEDCERLATFTMKQFGTLDVLVNNAGQFLPGDISLEQDGLLHQMLQVNLFSAYHLSRAIIPFMKKQQQGCIINMGSVAGLKAYEHGGSYSISKFALVGFSKNLRDELKPFGIKVSTINPGATMSDSWSGSGISEERIMEANDIAEVVAMIVSLSPQAVLEDVTLRPLLGDL